jgi:hypothetical protein
MRWRVRIAGLVAAGVAVSLCLDAEAALSESDTKKLSTAEINEAGVASSSPTSGRRSQVSLGAPFAAGSLTTTRFRMAPGFFAVVTQASATVPPPSDLDITVLYAKTASMGSEITPSSWQLDNDPIFVWEAPGGGNDIAGYSYAADAEPDDTIDTASTSWDVSQDAIVTLADGKRLFKVKAINTAGTSGAAASIEVWIDRTPPTISSTSPSPGALLGSLTPSLTAGVADAHSGVTAGTVTWLINGAAANVTVDPVNQLMTVTRATLREGTNALELRVADVAGNEQTPLVWSVTTDVTPPVGTLAINGGATMSSSVYVTLNLTASDGVSGVSRLLISNDPVVGFVEESFTTLRELWRLTAIRGSQRVYVKFADVAGNTSDAITDDILLSLTAPDTLIVSGPAGITPQRDATFTFTCPEDGCVFAYSFDGGDWSSWSTDTSATRDNLIFGNHYFAVKAAKETNGLTGIQPDEEDPVPAERTWIVGVEPTRIFVPRGNPIKLWRLE